MTDWTLRDLVDDIEHVAELRATAESFAIPHNDSRFNHSELGTEINEFQHEVNRAVENFQDALAAYSIKNWTELESRYGND
jgi:hypothetical protein